jgi:hypothetical protein
MPRQEIFESFEFEGSEWKSQSDEEDQESDWNHRRDTPLLLSLLFKLQMFTDSIKAEEFSPNDL